MASSDGIEQYRKDEVYKVCLQETECPICKECMKDPVHLPQCSHVFCKTCLRSCFKAKPRQNHIPCPTCRRPVPRKTFEKWNNALFHKSVIGVIQETTIITQQPSDVHVRLNEPFQIKVEVAYEPLEVQWYRNKHLLSSQVENVIEVSQTKEEDFGSYQCVVSTRKGRQTSVVAVVQEIVYVKFENGIHLLLNPLSQYVPMDGHVTLECNAKSTGPLEYQWFKGDRPINGASSRILKLYNVMKYRDEAEYSCEIRQNCAPEMFLTTPSATVTVEGINPSRKMAVLIINSACPWQAIENDVKRMTKTFEAMDFVVKTLFDLNMSETASAFAKLKSLVVENSYIVLYYIANARTDGGYRLTPERDQFQSDKRRISVKDTLLSLSQKRPALMYCFLDLQDESMDRAQGTSHGGLDSIEEVVPYTTLICLRRPTDAFSDSLWAYVQPHLALDGTVDKVTAAITTDLGKSGKLAVYPTIKHQHYSFHDKVQIQLKRQAVFEEQQWAEPLIPEEQNLRLCDVGVVLELSFTSPALNVIQVRSTAKTTGTTESCQAALRGFSKNLTVTSSTSSDDADGHVTVTTLTGLQRLKRDLTATPVLTYWLAGNPSCHVKFIEDITLGIPPVSCL